jgi:uncharacterized DUF497 family protein
MEIEFDPEKSDENERLRALPFSMVAELARQPQRLR